MPDLDGIEVCLRLKEITKFWNFSPFIIGCSGDTSIEIQQKFKNVGVFYFLNKPITYFAIGELKQVLMTPNFFNPNSLQFKFQTKE